MGVTHSMEEEQVKRISKALNASANAIQGINNKFETIDVHVQRMMEFNRNTNEKMDAAFRSFERLDDTFNDRAELFLEALVGATSSATDCLEAAVLALQKVNIRKEIDNIPKALIPLAIPFIILLIELAVSNAYLGILLASLPSVSLKYSNYLLAYASSTLLGLFLSLMWLVCYRVWLSVHTKGTSTEAQTVELLKKLRTRSGTTLSADSDHASEPPSLEIERQGTSESLGSPASAKDRASQLSSATSPMDRSSQSHKDRSSQLLMSPARGADSIARVRARREQRKLRRAESRNFDVDMQGFDESFSLSRFATPEMSPTSSPVHSPLTRSASELEMRGDPVRELIDGLPQFGLLEQAAPSDQDRGPFRRPRRSRGGSRSASKELAQDREGHLPSLQDTWNPDEAASSSSQGHTSHATVDKGRSTERRSGGMVQTRWNKWENPFAMEVTWGRKQRAAPTQPAAPGMPSGQTIGAAVAEAPPPCSSTELAQLAGKEGTEEFEDGEHLHL